jgi:hypothetical protein
MGGSRLGCLFNLALGRGRDWQRIRRGEAGIGFGGGRVAMGECFWLGRGGSGGWLFSSGDPGRPVVRARCASDR